MRQQALPGGLQTAPGSNQKTSEGDCQRDLKLDQSLRKILSTVGKMPVVTKGMYMLAVSPQHLNNILKTNKIVKNEFFFDLLVGI